MGNEQCEGCDLYINSHCTKWRKNGKPDPSTAKWLIRDKYDEPLHFIPVERICRNETLFGNEFIGLTQTDIDRIKNGEVVHTSVGEYRVFIGFVNEQEEK